MANQLFERQIQVVLRNECDRPPDDFLTTEKENSTAQQKQIPLTAHVSTFSQLLVLRNEINYFDRLLITDDLGCSRFQHSTRCSMEGFELRGNDNDQSL